MPAWDLVLRRVKDVALLYALGDQPTSRAAMQAHHAGVAAAVTYLDGQVGTRTGRDGAKHVAGTGLVAVGFTHRISRAGDPLPHTHLVIVNRTQGPDGDWRTLDSRDLLAHRQAAYRAHGRLVAAETPTQLKELLLGDWWQAFQHGDRVAILAHRREEVDQFNTACQQLKDHAGHLGREHLQVGDRSFAVGDLVVCGKNALRSLRVAKAAAARTSPSTPRNAR
jgi:conjugative relaxase-like TrwC/TraI family protein